MNGIFFGNTTTKGAGWMLKVAICAGLLGFNSISKTDKTTIFTKQLTMTLKARQFGFQHFSEVSTLKVESIRLWIRIEKKDISHSAQVPFFSTGRPSWAWPQRPRKKKKNIAWRSEQTAARFLNIITRLANMQWIVMTSLLKWSALKWWQAWSSAYMDGRWKTMFLEKTSIVAIPFNRPSDAYVIKIVSSGDVPRFL